MAKKKLREPSVDHTVAAVVHLALDALDFSDETFRYRVDLRTGPLKKSIETEGQALPIVVRPHPHADKKTQYQIVSGFRRATAMNELGRETIAAIVRTDLDDDKAVRASVLENSQRKTYSDIDRALAVRALIEHGEEKNGAAAVLGCTGKQVANILGLLELPDAVQRLVDDPDAPFTATHAYLLRQKTSGRDLSDEDLTKWAERVVDDRLSVSQFKRLLNSEYTRTSPGYQSVFRSGQTDGVFRLQPLRIEPAMMSDEDRAALREELVLLLDALR